MPSAHRSSSPTASCPGQSRRPANRCGQVYGSPSKLITPFAGKAMNETLAITIIVIAVIKLINAPLDILSVRRLKKHFQGRMIAQVQLTERVEVLRLHGTQRVRGQEMIEAIRIVVPVTPAPPILLCLPIVAMQPAIDIVQIVGVQPTQNTKLEFMLAGVFEDRAPVSLDVAPGDDLPVLALVLRCAEVATE